ncbi:MAG: Bug family tripartite tricarboxylate transporter substrate binding protein [Xanthobacteraceae bacterium]
MTRVERSHAFAATVFVAAVGSMLLSGARQASAQPYPSQDIHLIVGFAAGSGPDVIARFLAEKMRGKLNRTVIVENKVGAVGNIATEYVARAKPDGYTIYITGGGALAASGHLFKNPPVDVSIAFDVVATLSRQPTLMVVGPNSPAKTLPELTAILKTKGDKASYGTAFPTARVLGALYREKAGLGAIEVQYRTSKDWVNDLISGTVDFAFIDAVSGVGMAKEGRVRVVAGTTAERAAALPDVPTMKEGGIAIDMPGWWAAFTPAGTPKPILAQLHTVFSEILATDEGRKFFTVLGNDTWTTTLEEARAIYLKEYEDWGRYVKIAKIEPQG